MRNITYIHICKQKLLNIILTLFSTPGLRNKALTDSGFTEFCGAWPYWMALGSTDFEYFHIILEVLLPSLSTANYWLSFHFACLPAFHCFYLGLFKKALATVFLQPFSAFFPFDHVIYWILPRTSIMGTGCVQFLTDFTLGSAVAVLTLLVTLFLNLCVISSNLGGDGEGAWERRYAKYVSAALCSHLDAVSAGPTAQLHDTLSWSPLCVWLNSHVSQAHGNSVLTCHVCTATTAPRGHSFHSSQNLLQIQKDNKGNSKNHKWPKNKSYPFFFPRCISVLSQPILLKTMTYKEKKRQPKFLSL